MAGSRPRDREENAVIIIVTAVWAITFLLDPFVAGFSPRPEVAFAMTGIIGALWGARIFRKSSNGNGSNGGVSSNGGS